MINSFEEYVDAYTSCIKDPIFKQSIKYSLDGGKRIRPLFIFSILQGFNIDYTNGFDAALALELIQTYSLIHDDLPEMDNDDLRRGKPSLHKAFNPGIALLTGDGILTDSFSLIVNSDKYDDACKTKLVKVFSKYAGFNGMVYGQLLDITVKKDELDLNKLVQIHDNKTGGLFKIACLAPAIIANYDDLSYFDKLGSLIGLIFQSQDDLLDIISSKEKLGKSNSDMDHDKVTATSLFSIDDLKKHIDNLFIELDNHLKTAPFDISQLNVLIQKLKVRDK